MIDIYTKEDCAFCFQAKAFMQKKNLPYTEHLVGRDLTRDELIEKFPQMTTVPIIMVDNQLIGGYINLIERYTGVK